MEQKIIMSAAITPDNELIPLWDDMILFETDECGYSEITLKDNKQISLDIVECIYDLKDKTLSHGIELNVYPSEKDLPYKKGDTVLLETGYHALMKTIISDIKYKTYDIDIIKGNVVRNDYPENGLDNIDDNALYIVKYWKPTYIFDNGLETEAEYKLYILINK